MLLLLQIFALQIGASPSCNVLDIDIYFADANDPRASGDVNTPSKASASSSFAGRSGLVVMQQIVGRQKQVGHAGRSPFGCVSPLSTMFQLIQDSS